MDMHELIAEGLADIEAGRYHSFNSAEELRVFLRALAQEVFDSAPNSRLPLPVHITGIPDEAE